MADRLLSNDGCIANLTPSEVAMVAKAFARLGQPAPALFTKLAGFVEARAPDFELRELSSVLWALATSGLTSIGLPLSALKFEEWRLRDLNPSDISKLHWALACLLPGFVTLAGDAPRRVRAGWLVCATVCVG